MGQWAFRNTSKLMTVGCGRLGELSVSKLRIGRPTPVTCTLDMLLLNPKP